MYNYCSKAIRSLHNSRLSLAIVIMAIAAYTIIFYFLQVRLYDGLHMTIHDIQMSNQVLFNTIEGRFLENNYAIAHIDRWSSGAPHSIFEHHLYLILLLVLPFYYFFPGVHILLLIQSLATSCGALAIYLISKQVSRDNFISVCLGISYLMYPSVQGMTLNGFRYGFHPDILFPTFLLFAFYFFLKDRMGLTLLFSALGLLCSEHLSLTVVMFGLYVAMSGRKSRFPGTLIAIVSGIWVVLAVLVIIPCFRGAPPRYVIELVATSKTTQFEILPAILVTTLYTKYLFVPLAFTFLLNIPSLVLALPGMILSLASRYTGYSLGYDPFSWRMAQLAPFLFLSATLGIGRLHVELRRQDLHKRVAYGLTIAVLVGTFSSSLLFGPAPWSISIDEKQYAALSDTEMETMSKLKLIIRPDASLSADPYWGSHFTARRIIDPFPIGWDRDDFVLLVDKTEPPPRSGTALEYVQKLRESSSHHLILEENGVELYQRIRDVETKQVE